MGRRWGRGRVEGGLTGIRQKSAMHFGGVFRDSSLRSV